MTKQKLASAPAPTEKKEDKHAEEKIGTENQTEVKTETKEIKEEKKTIVKKAPVKRDSAVVNIRSVPISTKHSVAICDFIRYKKTKVALENMERALRKKMPVPMKGEIPHRKGRIMSGRYPIKALENFVIIVKSLEANATSNGINEPVIVEAIANMAQRPFGKFGTVRKKRTNISLKAVDLSKLRKGKEKKK